MRVRNISQNTIVIGRFTVFPGECLPNVPMSSREIEGMERLCSMGSMVKEDVQDAQPQPQNQEAPAPVQEPVEVPEADEHPAAESGNVEGGTARRRSRKSE